ncbi:MAG: hypothetical protein WCV81_00900 [Microgenomates group bacterium]|jgi:hypothetical protein
MENSRNNSNLTLVDDTLPAVTSDSEEYDVDIWWVKDVKPGDAKQAEKTMRALLNAGLKPRLVAHALEKGHGYEIESLITRQKFINLDGKMGELAATDQVVGAYEVVEKLTLGMGEQTVEEMVQEEGLIRAKVVTNIEQIRDQSQEQIQKIEMTVVIKQEPPKQIIDSLEDKIAA